ncbi:hypothetical protein JMJ35_004977 [Cladonia borealis]|uniref:Nephrocystin 3-like N-terminal domain-containing protein n=1 Tax=Cladonia borealis TaxID=184061 RepID=A0AA39R398_9LECA|nr:hypothetical protein JMJ35_004977 [Cladonia borealis]
MVKERGLLQIYHPKEGTTITADVVFVHGLFGDRQQTWTKKIKQHKKTPDPNSDYPSQPRKNQLFSRGKGLILSDSRAFSKEGLSGEGLQQPTSSSLEVFWPRDLLPSRFPDFRIFTWGYDVDIDHAFSGTSTATVFQHAANLLSDLCDVRISGDAESRPLFFVAHSLGGIVVKDALNQSLNAPTHQKAIARATAGVCFLGTPHRGTSIAALGETVLRISKLWGKSPNLCVLQALKYDAETLDRVQSSFIITLIDPRCKINIRSFREAEKHLGVAVVDRFSSIVGNPNEIVTDIQADHRNMTKFAQPDEPGFLSICNALDRWMKELSVASSEFFLESLTNGERRRRVDQVANPYDGTFDWLFNPKVGFSVWLSGLQQAGTPIFFWIQGKPGSGKSTLMKYALAQKKTRELLALADPGTWHLVPFFFHDRGSSIQKSVIGLLQELLYRLVEADEKLVAFIPARLIRQLLKRNTATTQVSMLPQQYGENRGQDYVHQGSSGAESWFADDLQEALIAITRQEEVPLNVLFFIDALDEHEGNHRDLIRVIQNSFKATEASKVKVKFCLASRPDPAFTNAFGFCPGLLVQEYTRDDVQWYAHQQIVSNILYRDIDQDMSELQELTVEITQRANGVFIWVRIVIEELIERFLDGSTISQLGEILSAMPEELKDLYRRTLSKVKPEYELESYVMTQIVLCARNTQTLKSLLVATDIALERKVERMSWATMERRLASRCGGLLEETSASGQIQFLHQTVKAFFTHRHHAISMFRHSEDSPAELGSYYMLKYCIYIATRLPSAELEESSETLKYLFNYAEDSSTAPESDIGELLECLIKKPRRCAFFPWEVPNATDDTKDGLQSFFLHGRSMSTSHHAPPHSRHRYYDLLSVSLHNGILSYAQYRFPHGLPRTLPGQAPLLHYALDSIYLRFKDNPILIDWLLEKGADPNERHVMIDNERITKGPTPLGYVLSPNYWEHFYETMELLLRGGASPNISIVAEDQKPMSALRLAMTLPEKIPEENCEEIVRILLKYKADCNQIDTEGFRPLYHAISQKLWKAAEYLLQYGANPSDFGNEINALQPQSFKHDQELYQGVMEMQALLKEYSTESEGGSRGESTVVEDYHDLRAAQSRVLPPAVEGGCSISGPLSSQLMEDNKRIYWMMRGRSLQR